MATTELAGLSALEFLAGRIDYERASTVPYDRRNYRLERMRQLLARLGNPQNALRIIHVAGTKGKGSTAAMIAAALGAAGMRTGLFSSPHLDHVEERIMIDGAICSSDELVGLVNRVRPVVAAMDAENSADEPGGNRPTYFEVITAMALVRFADRQVDAAVLEVGMGGRLDSTNVCHPQVSVITSISFDHTQQLGSTLAAIAGEKAGIIKPRAPVVSGVLADEPRQVVADVARQHGCPLVQLGRDFDFDYRPARRLDAGPAFGHVDFRSSHDGQSCELDDLELALVGRHQAANAAVAIATLDQLRGRGWQIPEESIRRGLSLVRWPARVEVLSRHPTVVLDSAHNVASVEALTRVLDESFSARRRLLVFAASRDKDIAGMLRALLAGFDEVIFTRFANNPRGVLPEELDSLAAGIAPTVPRHVCAEPQQAWLLAKRLVQPDDLVAITGSFFIAAQMRALVDSAPS